MNWIFGAPKITIPDEELEELKMLTSMEAEEICRLKDVFVELVGSETGMLQKDGFLDVDYVANNPLKDRLALCFGFDHGTTDMDFRKFIRGISRFNAPLTKDEKLRLAFKLQDFDNDGVLSREDVKEYLRRVTTVTTLPEVELDDIVTEVFNEMVPNSTSKVITFQDFASCMAPTDFHTKLILPF